MAVSDAQKRANVRYRKHAVKNMQLCFYPKDMELYKFLETKGNKSGYVKDLVMQAMKKEIAEGKYKTDEGC